MNPFIESTVAKPAATAQAWHKPYPVLSRVARVARRVARFGVAGILCSPTFATALDINTASLEQLQSIKGIGPKTAQIILDERQRGGSYESLADLSDRVKGIGPKKAASLQSQGLTAGGRQTSAFGSDAVAEQGPALKNQPSRTSGRSTSTGRSR